MNKPRLVRGAGLAAVLLFLVLVGRFWHPVYRFTSFLQLDATNDEVKIAAFHELPVYVYRDTGGYDGLYYAQIAYHPLLTAPELRPAMDNFSYRARRILTPALAWVLAAGQPRLIVHLYSCLNILAWLVVAGLLWRLLRVADGRSLGAWAGLLFSAGALLSVRFALTDLVTLAALTAAMAAMERGRPGWAVTGLAAAGLGRETSVVALPGFLRPPWLSWRNAAKAAAAFAPLAAWLFYVRWKTDWDDQPWGNFTWPGAGWLEKGRAAVAAIGHTPEPVLAGTTLLTFVGLTAQAIFFCKPRWADPWWRFGAPYVALLLFFGTAVWEGFPGAAPRVLLPLSVAFFVLVIRHRASWLWLLAGALTVPSGLLALAHPTSDPREIAAARGQQIASVVRAGPGWLGREQAGRHVWAWNPGLGELEIETWPRAVPAVRLKFFLRGLGTRHVVIRQAGREIWRGPVGRELQAVEIAVPLRRGRADLEFVTDAPGVAEGPWPGARSLAFAIYDPKIVTLP